MLELTIIEGLSPDNPTEKKKSFNDRGGVIGRDVKSDWPLFDPNRVISSHHAKVIFSQGAYFLSDLSVNGVSTEQGQKLRKGEYRPIKVGEVYVIGPYRIEVTALNTADEAASLKEAGLAHILNEPKKEEGLSPFDYVEKQNNPMVKSDPLSDFPFKERPNTLKAFDFMPEPIDFTQNPTATKAKPEANPCIPDLSFLDENCQPEPAVIQTPFIPQFCQLFQLDAKHFEGITDQNFKESINALFTALSETYTLKNQEKCE